MAQEAFYLRHFILSVNTGQFHEEKVHWFPAAPGTLERAHVVCADAVTNDRLYVNRYEEGYHMVAVNSRMRMISQFPYNPEGATCPLPSVWLKGMPNDQVPPKCSSCEGLGVVGSQNDLTAGIPSGSFCYGYVRKRLQGIASSRQFDEFIERRHGPEGLMADGVDFEDYFDRRFCPHWKPSAHGFAECTLLRRKAIWIASTADYEKAVRFFGGKEKLEAEVKGFLLGDGIKECMKNRAGDDFEFPHTNV